MAILRKKIKLLIVDDSILFREALKRGVEVDPSIEVVGVASDPFEARDMIIELEPDVMTLDVEMPKMSGIEFLKKLMPQYPIPIVVVSALSSNVFDALDAGAVDFVTKPDYSVASSQKTFINELIVKIKIASTAKVAHHKQKTSNTVTTSGASSFNNDKYILIGASTGGTEAIYDVIKRFPRNMPGVVVVQHMPPVFTNMYANRLNNSCQMEVKEAEDGDDIKPGRVLIAPGDFQLKIVKGANSLKVNISKGEKVSGHCPSVDVMFESGAKVIGKNAIGVILTGMGSDGAKGLLELKKSGAFTIGQDQQSSVVYGMPMVAYNIGAVVKQAALANIPDIIMEKVRR